MRIFFILSMLLFVLSFLPACNGDTKGSDVKIAVADVSRLMRDSVPGKAGIKFLEGRQAKFQKELDNIQDRLDKDPTDEVAMKDLQRVYSASQQQIQAEGQNVAAMLFDTLQRILDKFREENGYTLILGQDTVASFAKSVDVTDAIMKELDKEVLDFKPLPEAAPAEIILPENNQLPKSDSENVKASDVPAPEAKVPAESAEGIKPNKK